MNKLNDLCEKICEENYSYEELVELSKRENITIESLLKALKEYVCSPIEMSYFKGINEINEKEKMKLPFLNPILLDHGIKTYYLWESDSQYELMSKAVYGYCCTIGKENGCNILAKKYRLPIEILYELYDYYNSKLKKEAPIISSYVLPSITDIYFKSLFEILNKKNIRNFNAEDYAKLIRIIKDNNFSKFQLHYSLLGFLTKNKMGTNNYDQIKKIIDICFEYIKRSNAQQLNSKKEKEKITNATELIKDFISSGLSLEEYHDTFRVTSSRIEKSAETIKLSNPDLYATYSNIVDKYKKEKESIIKSELEKLYNYLINGIQINGIVRPFTIIDYYMNINIDFSKILIYTQYLNDEAMENTIKRFRSANVRYTYSVKSIASRMLKTDFFVQVNSGELKNITMEDKVIAIEYLKNNRIPLNERTIYLAFNLMLDGSLIQLPEEEKKEILKK